MSYSWNSIQRTLLLDTHLRETLTCLADKEPNISSIARALKKYCPSRYYYQRLLNECYIELPEIFHLRCKVSTFDWYNYVFFFLGNILISTLPPNRQKRLKTITIRQYRRKRHNRLKKRAHLHLFDSGLMSVIEILHQ